jgi:hypothetical protein
MGSQGHRPCLPPLFESVSATASINSRKRFAPFRSSFSFLVLAPRSRSSFSLFVLAPRSRSSFSLPVLAPRSRSLFSCLVAVPLFTLPFPPASASPADTPGGRASCPATHNGRLKTPSVSRLLSCGLIILYLLTSLGSVMVEISLGVSTAE